VRVPLSWLREFVPVEDSAEAVARTLSVRGFAVEGIEHIADEAVLDFEVTANRPDCMSVIGMAREVAVAYGLPLRGAGSAEALPQSVVPVGARGGTAEQLTSSALDIIIENPELCPRYAGAVVDVAVATSPDWMQRRLHGAGIRPISNIVDITNYVLLELGQPMHAFDLSRLTGAQIRV